MLPSKNLSSLLPSVISIAQAAGALILDIYEQKSYHSFLKDDQTPVTNADLISHQYILEQLRTLTPSIPTLSEEDITIDSTIRQKWRLYWLIDPLDGTKEFIDRSGDFACSIALIENNQPIMGAVFAPVSNVTYYAYSKAGAWKLTKTSEKVRLHLAHQEPLNNTIKIVTSRRQNEESIIKQLNHVYNYKFIHRGSAVLKGALIAEGLADCYIRLGPTGEWDTAAIQCIVEEAGGQVLDINLAPLSYNERDILINPDFIILGNANLPWSTILK